MGDCTENFSFSEFVVSDDYPEIAKDIKLSLEDTLNIRLLCESCLQPTRNMFGKQTVKSGKRNKELNKLVGGQPDSGHLMANAADIAPPHELSLIRQFVWMAINLPYRQLILYPERGIIHVSVNIPSKKYKHEYIIIRD